MKKIVALIIFFLLYIYLFFGTSLVLAGNQMGLGYTLEDPDQEVHPFKPGDGLAINTFPDTSSFLNNVFPIDDRGFAEFPIVGKINVSSMTKNELKNYLNNTFRAWLRNPNIYIKPVIRISLLGGFQRPGLYYIDNNSSLWEAVHLAGGPILQKGIYKMKWERNGDEQSGDLTRFFESGISLRSMGFRSGDQIRTPPISESFWDKFRTDFIPIVTFISSMALLYLTYQRELYFIQRGAY